MKYLISVLMIFGLVTYTNSGEVVRPATEASLVPRIKIVSTYTPKSHVYKGIVHDHTSHADGGSDGSQTAVSAVTTYRDRGFNFVSITDHNRIKPDPQVPGILYIPGMECGSPFIEYSANPTSYVTSASYHICVLNAQHMPNMTTPQQVLDTARSYGSFTTINHPDDSGWSLSKIMSMTNYYAVEVYNGTRDVRYDTTTDSVNKIIDPLLNSGRRFFLVAGADAHSVNSFIATNTSVRVFANDLTVSEIMDNLKSGNFYSSSGAEFSSISVSSNTITVTTPNTCEIQWVSKGGVIVQDNSSTNSSTYIVTGSDDTYIRARAYRYTGQSTLRAWTNPFYIEKLGYVHVGRKIICGGITNDLFDDISIPESKMVSWRTNNVGFTTQTVCLVNGLYVTNSYSDCRLISWQTNSVGFTTQTVNKIDGNYVTNTYHDSKLISWLIGSTGFTTQTVNEVDGNYVTNYYNENRIVSYLTNSSGFTTQTVGVVNGNYVTNSYTDNRLVSWLSNNYGFTTQTVHYANGIFNTNYYWGNGMMSYMTGSTGFTTQTVSIVNGSVRTNYYKQ